VVAESIVCATCATPVPAGRLSCPACGELLASVSGGSRVASGAVTTSATPAVLYELALAPTSSLVDGDIEGYRRSDDAAIDTDPDASLDLEPRSAPAPRSTLGPWSEAPGAYLPPAFTPPAPIPAIPAGPAAPARAWAGHGADRARMNGSSSTAAVPGRAEASPPSTAGDRPRVAEFVGWLAVAGAALAAVGFLLPWSSSVIGASGVGYFDRWGLAGPLHVLVVLGLLATLALSLVRHPLPLRLAIGLPGVGLGSLLLGLVWPYVLGPLGAGPGVVIVALGAVMLGAAGVVAIVSDRHAEAGRPV
jgi:hypothetical protein